MRYNRIKILSVEVMNEMRYYEWPGNIRELKNVVERLVVTTLPEVRRINHLPEHWLENNGSGIIPGADFELKVRGAYFGNVDDPPPTWREYAHNAPEEFSLKSYMEFCKQKVINEVLEEYGTTREAAKFLKVDQSTIVKSRRPKKTKNE